MGLYFYLFLKKKCIYGDECLGFNCRMDRINPNHTTDLKSKLIFWMKFKSSYVNKLVN